MGTLLEGEIPTVRIRKIPRLLKGVAVPASSETYIALGKRLYCTTMLTYSQTKDLSYK